MASEVAGETSAGLERSCEARDWIRCAPSRPGLERVEACFARHAFAPHRHDTYAIGITLDGVQAFDYRGGARRSTAGQTFVLHPDELHDGRAGSDAGFRYRILYIEPSLMGEALGEGCALPFVREAVCDDARLLAAIAPALADLDLLLDDLLCDEIVAALAEALAALDGSLRRRRAASSDRRAVLAARAYLDSSCAQAVRSSELETVTGLDRYALARQFRRCLGTSPHRYLVMRRLGRARALIAAGQPLCQVALATGFADQSHLTRQFKQAYGLPPGRWAALQLDSQTMAATASGLL